MEPNVAVERAGLVVGPGVDEAANDAEGVVGTDAGQFVGVPFAGGAERDGGALRGVERVEAAGGFLGLGRRDLADLHLVAATHGDPGIVGGVREAEEDSQVRLRPVWRHSPRRMKLA